MLRKLFIQKNIHTKSIKRIIGHNGSIFLSPSIKIIILLIGFYVIFVILNNNINFESLNWIFGIIGIGLLAKYIINFLNLYLDGLVLSPEGITLYLWEGLLEYRTEYFDREKIVTINHNQKGVWDKIFKRGDLLINLEQGIEFPFENITSPKKQVDKIMRLKELYTSDYKKQEDTNEKKDPQMDVVIEAFSEIIKDYMDKNQKKDGNDEEKYYNDIY